MYLRRLEHLTLSNAMYCEGCGYRRYRDVERFPEEVSDGKGNIKYRTVTLPQKHDANFKLVLWRYTYVCRDCGDIKILVIGHKPGDTKGGQIHFLWGFTLCTDDEITNEVRLNYQHRNKKGKYVINGWAQTGKHLNKSKFLLCYDKFRWGKKNASERSL